MKIQLALQGGGAKLCALLAVAEAAQYLQKKKELEIGRVAGTSAGAIVGAILAAGVDIKSLRRDLQNGEGKKLVGAFPKIGDIKAMWRVFWGKPFWDTQALRDWLTNVFTKKSKVEELVKDPNKQIVLIKDCEAVEHLIVMTSNLSDGVMNPCQGKDALVAALMDSSALPFCFRTWTMSGNLILDGGLGENLPVRQLSTEVADHGELVAVTFERTPPEAPRSAKNFAKALMGFAIDASVERACASVEAHRLLRVKTKITTMDFERAITEGLGDEYNSIYDQALAFFRALKPPSEAASIEPWSVSEPAMKRMMDDLAVMYDATHRNRMLIYDEVVFEVTARCLLPGDTASKVDKLVCKMKLAPKEHPISCHAISLAGLGEREYHGRIEPKLLDASGDPINCRIVPTYPSSPRMGQDERQVLIFFDEWMKPGNGMYELRFRDEGNDIMWMLRQKGHDEIQLGLPRATGVVKRVTIVLHVPKIWPNICVTEDSPTGRRLLPKEMAAFDPPEDFVTLGRVFENVEANLFTLKFANASPAK